MSEIERRDDSDLMALLATGQASAWDPRSDEAVDARKRGRRRGAIAAGIVVIVVAAAVGTYVSLSLNATVAAPTVTLAAPTPEQPTAVNLMPPTAEVSAVSVTGAEQFPGTVGTDGLLVVNGSADARPIASLTKVITALVVLGAKPLAPGETGPTLTFSKADNDLYDKYYVLGAVIQPMKIGSAMTQRDALEVMLVPSASNYGEAVSNWAFGSTAGFRSATKTWLAANGLSGTTIVEPTGIDPRNTSTPADLIALAKIAMANPVVAEIVASRSVEVPNIGRLSNTNPILGTDGVMGLKTGTLGETGSNLLFASSIDVGLPAHITITGVVLGASDNFAAGAAARTLIASVRSGFQTVQLVEMDTVVGSYTTPWGDDADVVTAASPSVLTWSDTPVSVTLESTPVREAKSGTEVGSLTYVVGSETVVVPLELRGGIAGPGGQWRLTHPEILLAQ